MSELIAVIVSLATVGATIVAWLSYLHQRGKRVKWRMTLPWLCVVPITLRKNQQLTDGELPAFTEVTPISLLRYYWDYPLNRISNDFSERSWAVKESLVLKGDIIGAREHPGLGAAIISVEIALRAFGEVASSDRISQLVNWAMQRASKEQPYLLTDNVFYPQDSRLETVEDFRHTLAFAVILGMTGRLPSHKEEYLRLTLESQRHDGGWDAGSGVTISELFTVTYAILFLVLCLRSNCLSPEQQSSVADAVMRAVAWVVDNRKPSGQWYTDVLYGYPWGNAITTAWVLRGLSIVADKLPNDWIPCAQIALETLVSDTINGSLWHNVPLLQRFRVETRIAAAIHRSPLQWISTDITREKVIEYLSGWRSGAKQQLTTLRKSDMDLSTVMYMLDSFYTWEDLETMAQILLTEEPHR